MNYFHSTMPMFILSPGNQGKFVPSKCPLKFNLDPISKKIKILLNMSQYRYGCTQKLRNFLISSWKRERKDDHTQKENKVVMKGCSCAPLPPPPPPPPPTPSAKSFWDEHLRSTPSVPLWNSLPDKIKDAETINSFRRMLKTYLFLQW